MTNQIKTSMGVLSAVVLWGISWLASKTVLTELLPRELAMLRLMMAAGAFYILLKALYRGHRIEREDRLYTWCIGVFCIGGYLLIQGIGLSQTTTVNSSIILGSSPILTTLISAKIFHQEDLTWTKLLGAFVGFAGIYLIFSGGSGFALGQATLRGDMIMLLSSIVWAFFGVLSKRLVDKYEPFVAIAYAYIFGAITLSPLIFMGDMWSSVLGMSIRGWGGIIFLSVFCSVYAFYAWYQGIKILGASRTSVFNYLNPLVAVIIGFLLLKEPVDSYTVLGGLAIFSGVYIASLGKSERLEVKG